MSNEAKREAFRRLRVMAAGPMEPHGPYIARHMEEVLAKIKDNFRFHGFSLNSAWVPGVDVRIYNPEVTSWQERDTNKDRIKRLRGASGLVIVNDLPSVSDEQIVVFGNVGEAAVTAAELVIENGGMVAHTHPVPDSAYKDAEPDPSGRTSFTQTDLPQDAQLRFARLSRLSVFSLNGDRNYARAFGVDYV